ncbi:MAG: methyltransferase domain-containing protein [Candidatus Lokiarchaeota archaeon]|nr:methyltransferase domain-containing protein [Candidatus Lokiarchaeota archaeon]
MVKQENLNQNKWAGDFGIRYTQRNKILPYNLIPFFKKITSNLELQTILEVGCNRGHNLIALSYCGQFNLFGIDISPYSIALARENKEISFSVGNVFDIMYKDNYFDLVFTSGLLIHINPEKLISALSEIIRVSKRYFLMLEYQDDALKKFKKINYRDNVGLWKGNFKKAVLDNFDVKILFENKTGPSDGFGDKRKYILFEKLSLV